MASAPAPLFQRRQSVGGLARLRHRDHHGALVNRRLAVAELGRVVDLGRHAAQLLDHEFADERSDPGGARADHHDPPDRLRTRRRQQLALEAHRVGAGRRAAAQRIDPGLRLLCDLLAQVVLEAALGGGHSVPLDEPRRAFDRHAVESHQAHAMRGELGQLAVLEHDGAAGMTEDRRNIGSNEVLAVAQPEHQWRRRLGGDQLVGLGLREHHDRERPAQFEHRLAHRLGQAHAGAHPLLDEMRDEFGVGLGTQLMTASDQLRAQFDVVLDDAVMNDRNRARLVRMGIALRGTPMRRPSRVANSDRSLKRRAIKRAAQVLELADRAADFHPGAADRRDAGRVVAAILQARERSEQNRHRLRRAHVSDYSAHASSTLSRIPLSLPIRAMRRQPFSDGSRERVRLVRPSASARSP